MSPGAAVATSERSLVVARHAETIWSADGRFAGQLDVPLSAAGRSRAAALGAALAAQRPAAVLTSDLGRAMDTAREVAQAAGAPVVAEPRLREEFLGDWQGRTRVEVAAASPEAYRRWQGGDIGAYDGREGLHAVARRAVAAVRDALGHTEGGHLVVVTHANTAVALLGSLLDLPSAWWLAVDSLAPAHWSALRGGVTRWRLQRHNVPPPDDKERAR